MTDKELRQLPWYGGNKIPDSYLKKFCAAVESEGIPHDLRIFIDQLGKDRNEPHRLSR